MSVILIELNTAKRNFLISLNNLTSKLKRNLDKEHPLYIDTLYTTLVSSILTGMLEDIKNKRLTSEVIDSSPYIQPVTDNLMYSFYDKIGYNMSMEEAYEFTSSIESGILEDVVKYIPEIDGLNVEILDFHFLATNSVAIDYKTYENSSGYV